MPVLVGGLAVVALTLAYVVGVELAAVRGRLVGVPVLVGVNAALTG